MSRRSRTKPRKKIQHDATAKTVTPEKTAPDLVDELTTAYTTTEKAHRFVPIPNVLAHSDHDQPDASSVAKWTRITKRAVITHPSLLDQLEEAVQQSSTEGAYGGGAAKSKPAARLDALAVLQRIDHQSTNRARGMGLGRMPLRPRLTAIADAVGHQPDDQIKAWWVAARCATGWETHPYSPDVPCPNTECERRSTLRIRLDASIASCIECGAVWDEHNYVQLGEYVRWAFTHLTGARHWLFDAQGFPVECTECLVERQMMAERKVARARAERDADAPAKAAV